MSHNKIDIAREAIELAKFNIDNDPHLSNFILRDLKVVKEAGLDDLSWAMHKEGCCKNDVLGLIEYIEKYIGR